MTRDTCLSKRNKTSFYSLCSKKPSSPEQLCNVFLNNLLVPIYTPEGGGNGENSVFNVRHAQFPPKRPPLKVSTVISKPKSEIARISSTRKLSKYSLLREKVIKLPYVSRLLPLHQWIKSNCKLCAWYNVQIKTKILNLKLLARAVWEKSARV